jgi:NAD(P)H-flavin reductase
MLIGPFFYVPRRIICHSIPAEKGENRFGKLDDPYGHDALWEAHGLQGDYIHYPRGRVIFDTQQDRAIIYIDRCIHIPPIIRKVVELFEIDGDYTVVYDDHYRCKNCTDDPFADPEAQ